MTTTQPDLSDITVTIPYPSYIPRARGINAVAKFQQKLAAACSKDEHAVVQQAAHAIGLSYATFIRWCSVECAKQVIADQARKEPKHDTELE